MTITIVMTFELNFYVLPTEVLIMAISIFCIFDRMVHTYGWLQKKLKLSEKVLS
jgi:hypothetical protein